MRMKICLGPLAAAAAILVLGTPSRSLAAPARADLPTSSGISLEQPWRQKIYAFATENLRHPAWGWRHSQRDYLLAVEIARREHLTIDTDILFAAAFLHDAGAISPFAEPDVDHADRSAELAEPRLRSAGFPMAKFPAVRASILGHMFDRSPGPGAEAIILHDADLLDFLGASGVARRLAVTGDAPDLDSGLARIDSFASELPGRLLTRSAKRMARDRVRWMRGFLEELKRETPLHARP